MVRCFFCVGPPGSFGGEAVLDGHDPAGCPPRIAIVVGLPVDPQVVACEHEIESLGEGQRRQFGRGEVIVGTSIAALHHDAVSVPVHTTGPVLFLFAVDPPMAFGTGTYVDDLWTAMGGTNAMRRPGDPAITAEDVVRLAPAAIISIGRSEIPAWMADASGALIAIDAPDLLEPSARMLVQGPASLRRADDAIVAMTDAQPGVSK